MASFFSNNLDHFTTSLSYGPKGGTEFISPLSAECMLQYKKKAAAYMKSLKKVCSASMLAQREHSSVDSWLCQREYKRRICNIWNGRDSLNDSFWLRKWNPQCNNATENFRDHSCPHNWGYVPVLPLPISTNYFCAKTPRRRVAAYLNFLPYSPGIWSACYHILTLAFTGRQWRAIGGKKDSWRGDTLEKMCWTKELNAARSPSCLH